MKSSFRRSNNMRDEPPFDLSVVCFIHLPPVLVVVVVVAGCAICLVH